MKRLRAKLINCNNNKVVAKIRLRTQNNLIALLEAEKEFRRLPLLRGHSLVNAGMYTEPGTYQRDLTLEDEKGVVTDYIIELY